MQNWISAILLDLDGTLIDSNDAHARAWAEALARHDHPVPFHRIRPLIGEGGDHLLPELTGIPDRSPLGRAIASGSTSRNISPACSRFPARAT
jgi:beta-phosphoglucomutase-like phosphatase (HAD superfamily)